MLKSIIQVALTVFVLFSFFKTSAQESMMGGCVVTFNLGNDVTICSSTSVYALTTGSPSGGTYSGTGVLDEFFFPSIAGQGEHIITYSYDNGFCIGSASDTITVVAPIPIEISGDMELCFGESTTITALNGEDIEWETGSNTTSETFTPDETTFYTVYGYDINGCLAATGYEIIVHPLPVIVFEGDTSLCIGESTVITATGGSEYLWSTSAQTDFIDITPLTDTEYSVTVTTEFTCVASDTVEITVHDYPIVEIFGDAEVCQFEPAMLFVNGDDSYIWSTSEETSSIIVSPLSDSTYSILATNIHGCSTLDEFEVIVHELPQVVIDGDIELCQNESSTLVATGALNYFWNGGPNSDQFIVTPMESTSYSVNGINEFDCENSTEVTVIVHPTTNAVAEIISSEVICIGDTILLNLPGMTDATWSYDVLSVQMDILTFIPSQVISSINYFGNDEFGCTTSIGNSVILANQLPVVSFTGETEICSGAITNIVAEGATSFIWSNGTETALLAVMLVEQTSFLVTGMGENGCAASIEIAVVVHELPEILLSGETQICLGESSTLTATGASEYIWSDGSENDSITISVIEDESWNVEGTDEFGCQSTLNFTIVVDSIPNVFVDEYSTICSGDFLALTAYGAETYLWSSGSQEATTEVSPLMTSDFIVTGTDGNGCSETEIVTIEVYDQIELIFTLAMDTICDLSGAMDLQASPPGGNFTGNGVELGQFVPSSELWGNNEIVYSLMDEFGCVTETVQTVFVDDCTAIAEDVLVQSSVFPNPFVEDVSVIAETNINAILIYNLDGKLIFSKSNVNAKYTELSLSKLPSGIYFLKIELADSSEKIHRITKD